MLVLLALAACSSAPEPKDPARPFDYQVWFDSDDVAVHTVLTYKGEPAGHVERVKTWEAGKELSFGTVTLPMNWKEDPEARLGILANTPCGPKEVPIAIDGVPTATIKVMTPAAEDLPKATLVYQTWGRGVKIGQADLLPVGNAWSVSGLDCAPEHDITVNDAVVGRMTTPEKLDYVLVPASSDDCYVYTAAVFSRDGGGGREVPLSGAWAYGLEDKVDRPFEQVDRSVRVDEVTAGVGMVLRYLTKVDCSPK